MSTTTVITVRTARRTQERVQIGKPTTYGGDWSQRDDPLPDPSVLLRPGSPRCLCNNGCRHVFSSETPYDRHLEMRPDGSARCRTPAELRSFGKKPMARDAAGVWFTPSRKG